MPCLPKKPWAMTLVCTVWVVSLVGLMILTPEVSTEPKSSDHRDGSVLPHSVLRRSQQPVNHPKNDVDDNEVGDNDDDKVLVTALRGGQEHADNRQEPRPQGHGQTGTDSHQLPTTADQRRDKHVHHRATVMLKKDALLTLRKKKRNRRHRKKKKKSSSRSLERQFPQRAQLQTLFKEGLRSSRHEEQALPFAQKPRASKTPEPIRSSKDHVPQPNRDGFQNKHHGQSPDKPQESLVQQELDTTNLMTDRQTGKNVTISEGRGTKGKDLAVEAAGDPDHWTGQRQRQSNTMRHGNVPHDQNLPHKYHPKKPGTGISGKVLVKNPPAAAHKENPHDDEHVKKQNKVSASARTQQHDADDNKSGSKSHLLAMTFGVDGWKFQGKEAKPLKPGHEPVSFTNTNDVNTVAEKTEQTKLLENQMRQNSSSKKITAMENLGDDHSEEQLTKHASLVDHYSSMLSAQQKILNQIIQDTSQAEDMVSNQENPQFVDIIRSEQRKGRKGKVLEDYRETVNKHPSVELERTNVNGVNLGQYPSRALRKNGIHRNRFLPEIWRKPVVSVKENATFSPAVEMPALISNSINIGLNDVHQAVGSSKTGPAFNNGKAMQQMSALSRARQRTSGELNREGQEESLELTTDDEQQPLWSVENDTRHLKQHLTGTDKLTTKEIQHALIHSGMNRINSKTPGQQHIAIALTKASKKHVPAADNMTKNSVQQTMTDDANATFNQTDVGDQLKRFTQHLRESMNHVHELKTLPVSENFTDLQKSPLIAQDTAAYRDDVMATSHHSVVPQTLPISQDRAAHTDNITASSQNHDVPQSVPIAQDRAAHRDDAMANSNDNVVRRPSMMDAIANIFIENLKQRLSEGKDPSVEHGNKEQNEGVPLATRLENESHTSNEAPILKHLPWVSAKTDRHQQAFHLSPSLSQSPPIFRLRPHLASLTSVAIRVDEKDSAQTEPTSLSEMLRDRLYPLPEQSFVGFPSMFVDDTSNSSVPWMIGPPLRKQGGQWKDYMDNSTSSQAATFFETKRMDSYTLVTSLGLGTTVAVFSCFLALCGFARWYRHRQYRKTYDRLEKNFSGLDADTPVYLRLCRLRHCQAGNQYVVTIVDDSKFSVVEHDLESEDEIFDITDMRSADKRGPLSRLQWTSQTGPY